MLFEVNQLRHEQKDIGKKIGAMKKKKEDTKQLVEDALEVKKKITELELETEVLQAERDRLLFTIGNIVALEVPDSKNEDDNLIVKTWGECKPPGSGKTHDQVLYMIGGFEPKIGHRVSGHRGYFLTGPGLWLNQALINYGLQFLHKRKFKTIQTPFLMNKDIMGKVCQLEDFEDSLYTVMDGKEEKFLIATSEQPICGIHQGEYLHPKDLPIRYAGYSTCFRKEAGSSGKDMYGLFRVHQFEKVEQFAITSPEESWNMHEELLKNSEDFYQSLGISYRVVSICSGALNNAAAKKYDLEAWFPYLNTFRELVSCSNCTDYQSRRLGIHFGNPTKDEKIFVHMLNCTLVATERTLCCIVENYQTDKGVIVPEVLRPYLAPYLEDPTFIPFVRESFKHQELDEETQETKKE